jgi:putative membrane protein insertion efficiency factor
MTTLGPMTIAQRLLLALVRGYRLLLSPWLGNHCRFEPTCSAYSMQAIEDHGAAVGAYLTAGRLLRCQPFCRGGHDPVPARRPALFRFRRGFDAPAPATPPSHSETRP